MRGGFCPRQRLCKLDHSAYLHTSPPQPAPNLTGGASKVPFGVGNPSKFLPVSTSQIGRLPPTLSTPKRFHPMDGTEDAPVITTTGVDTDIVPVDTKVVAMTTTVVAMDTPTITQASTGTERGGSASGCIPSYRRSVSSPVVWSQRDNKESGNDTKREACQESGLAERRGSDPTSPSLDEARGEQTRGVLSGTPPQEPPRLAIINMTDSRGPIPALFTEVGSSFTQLIKQQCTLYVCMHV